MINKQANVMYTQRTIKMKLGKLVNSKDHFEKIYDVVDRMNELTVHVYQFLRLWILSRKEVPIITNDTVKMCFKTLTNSNRGRPPKGESERIYKELKEFNDNVYSKLGPVKIDSKNLSGPIAYESTQIVTAIDNNIRNHYIDHIRRFINTSFKDIHKKEIDSISNKKEKQERKKVQRKNLYTLKNDLLHPTKEINSVGIYKDWFFKHRNMIVDKEFSMDILYSEPQMYMKNMLYISRELERMKKKQFQFFPLRNSYTRKHITIDTKLLIELFSKKGEVGSNLSKVMEIQEDIWSSVINREMKIFKNKRYTFDYMINTNGYEVGILFIKNDQYEKKKQGKIKRVKAGNKAKKEYKDKSDKEIEEIKKTKKEEKKEESKIQREKYKEENKGKSKEREFKYINELNAFELADLEASRKVYVDPGKGDLVTMLEVKEENGERKEIYYKYTNGQRLMETKRLKLQEKREKKKEELGIMEIEKELAETRSRTCEVKEFEEYIRRRNIVMKELMEKYKNEAFTKYNWYGKINRKRSEDKLVNRIIEKFGEDTVYIYGDWSANTNLKNSISTPGIGLKRKLKKRLKIINIDEYNTSKLYYKTGEEGGHLEVEDSKGESLRLYRVLTFQMENKRIGCINRDKNAVLNFEKLTTHYLKYRERIKEYRRKITTTL